MIAGSSVGLEHPESIRESRQVKAAANYYYIRAGSSVGLEHPESVRESRQFKAANRNFRAGSSVGLEHPESIRESRQVKAVANIIILEPLAQLV
jgi:hypothetical protein